MTDQVRNALPEYLKSFYDFDQELVADGRPDLAVDLLVIDLMVEHRRSLPLVEYKKGMVARGLLRRRGKGVHTKWSVTARGMRLYKERKWS